MHKDDKCTYCDNLVSETRRVGVDCEPDDEGGTHIIYGDVGVCSECGEALDNGDLVPDQFEPY